MLLRWPAGLVWAFLGLALLYPLGRILALGLGEGLGLAWANPYYWGRLAWSLAYGLGSSLLVVALALPLAYAFRYRFPGRDLLLSLATVPFVLPTLVVALGFLALVGPRGILGVNLYGTPWILLWASAFYNLGLVLRMLVAQLPTLEAPLAAARTLGASPGRAYWRVGLPLLAPALLAGGGLTFLYSFSSFGLPLVLGGPRYATLEVEVYGLLAYRLAFPEATALILLQLAVSALVTLLYLSAQTRLSLSLSPSAPPKPLSPGLAGRLAVGVWLFFWPCTRRCWPCWLEPWRPPKLGSPPGGAKTSPRPRWPCGTPCTLPRSAWGWCYRWGSSTPTRSGGGLEA